MLDFYSELFDFILKLKEILKAFAFFSRISQKCCGVECAHHECAVLFIENTVLLCYLEIGGDETHCGNSADTYDDFRTHDTYQLTKPHKTLVHFLRSGVTVFRRSAFEHIGYIYVFLSVKTYAVEIQIKELASSYTVSEKTLQKLGTPSTTAATTATA